VKYAGYDYWQIVHQSLNEIEDPAARHYAAQIVKAGRRGEFLLGFAWGALSVGALAMLLRWLLP